MALIAPTLNTPRLRLRPVEDRDGDALLELHGDASVMRYWDSSPWGDRRRADRFIATSQQDTEDGTGVTLAVDRTDDGSFLGWCSLDEWSRFHRTAELGYCFREDAWGQGYATEAASAILTWAFEALPLRRVQAETDTRNAASARVLEKLGFVQEGTLREDSMVGDAVSSTWVFGLLAREWRPGA